MPAAAAPMFDDAGPLTTDSGNVQLGWQAEGAVTLEMAAAGEAVPLYRGTNDSFFLTGLHDGNYTLRLIEEDSGEAAEVTLAVTHQSLGRALWLVGLGALVFLLTVGVIVRGARREESQP